MEVMSIRKLKKFVGVLMLVFVFVLASPQAWAGDIGTPGATGDMPGPGITGPQESPGVTGDIQAPGFIELLFGISWSG
jgi:hypothetical protein